MHRALERSRAPIPLLLALVAFVGCTGSDPGEASARPDEGAAAEGGTDGLPREYRLSQRATVSQRLANTEIAVEYSRPAARGRSPVFGDVVHFGEVWTPGANEATVLELSDDATIEGTPVPAGRWSMWIIPSDVGAWELLLHPEEGLFHNQRPEIGAEGQIRFDVPDEVGEHVETLTWDFPVVDRNRGTLRMAWGGVRVPLEVEVPSNVPETVVSAEEAARYEGVWRVEVELPPGAPEDGPAPPPMEVPIRRGVNGHLRVELPPEARPGGGARPPEPDPSASPLEQERTKALIDEWERTQDGSYYAGLVPYAEGIFRMGWFGADGTVLDVENVFFEFEFDEGGVASGLVLRSPDDQIMGRGQRVDG